MPSTTYGRYSTYSSSPSYYPSYRSSTSASSFLNRTTSLDRTSYGSSGASSNLGGSGASGLYSSGYGGYTGYSNYLSNKRLSTLPPRPSYSSDTYKTSRSVRISPARSSYNISSLTSDRESRYPASYRYREASLTRDSGYSSRLSSRDHSYDYPSTNGDISRRSSLLRRNSEDDNVEEEKVKVSERVRVFESKADPAEERLALRRQRLGLSPHRDSSSPRPTVERNNRRQSEENGNDVGEEESSESISDLCRKYNSNLNLSNGIDPVSELSGCSGGATSTVLPTRDAADGAHPSSPVTTEVTTNGHGPSSILVTDFSELSGVSSRGKSPSISESRTSSTRLNTLASDRITNRYSSDSIEYVPYRLRDRKERVRDRISKRIASEVEDGDSPPSRRRSPTGGSTESFSESNGLVGLRNIGNTCFLNSIVQCLSNTRCLMEYLVREGYSSDINVTQATMKGDLVKSFAGLLIDMWREGTSDSHCPLNPGSFKSQIQRFAPTFIGYAQHDAQEFLRKLLEGLHEDVNRVTTRPRAILQDIDESLDDNQKAMESWKRYLRYDDSKIVDMFVGQLKSSLKCSVCSHRSVTFDPFWDLSLPIPSRSGQVKLSQCLELFTKEEVLDGDERPTCAKCRERRKMTKSFSIQKFPKVLVLHLKRFSPHERWRGKLTCMVEFPLDGLDLSRYSASASISSRYRLIGVANHSGTALSGHYTAYCRHPYLNTWHEYNDSRVSSISTSRVCSAEAYVLFFELNSY